MLKEIDDILNDYYLGKFDLIEVRKKILELYGKFLNTDTSSCNCDISHPFPHADLTTHFCVKCGKNINKNEISSNNISSTN